jgi:hypothetical protein
MGFIGRLVSSLFSASSIKHVLTNVAVFLGLTVVTYAGVSLAINAAISGLKAEYAGLPADIIAVLAIAKVPNALSVILSAFVVRLTMMGLTSSGALKRILWRPGQQGSLF